MGEELAGLTSGLFTWGCLRGLPRPLFSVASFSFGDTVPLSLMFAYLALVFLSFLFPLVDLADEEVTAAAVRRDAAAAAATRRRVRAHTHGGKKKILQQLNSVTAAANRR